MNARCVPGRILGDHAEEQDPHLLGYLFSPNPLPGPRDQLPIKTKISSVSADHYIRSDDDEGPLPTEPESPSSYSEESVKGAENRPRMAALQYHKLLA
jgi:hypothetical protein